MKKIIGVLLAAVFVVALPFLFHQQPDGGDWKEGDPVLTVVTPHNEAIRHEFAIGFSRWHEEKYGRPVRLDWRVIGGTTEIMRYLASEYIGSMKGWWERQGRDWPAAGGTWILDRRFDPGAPPPPEVATNETARAEWALRRELYLAFRTNDTFDVSTSRMDLFFGGGVYDHSKAEKQGLTVPAWPSEDAIPVGLVRDDRGRELIPEALGGEQWRSLVYYGSVLSMFGICYNPDRLRDLGIGRPPAAWSDLADPAYLGQVGVTDPTKSGSVAKAFEMIIHQAMAESVAKAGYSREDCDRFEAAIAAARLPAGQVPEGVPAEYQAAVGRAWFDGLNLVRRIGANTRYFTDSAGKVPIDVGMGATAAGVCIDFFGRFQAEYAKAPDGSPHMAYVTPKGGSCVSPDPISVLRGAPHRELAGRFMEFVLGEDGQALWNGRVGTEGGPKKFALRRLPIRRDFYPSDDPVFNEAAKRHAAVSSDPIDSDEINPFALADSFIYRDRWTAVHFGIQRDLIRAMCLDSGDELKKAWRTILAHGGPDANPEAMALLEKMPEKPFPVTWASAVTEYRSVPRLEYMRVWTSEFRANYRQAARLASRDATAGDAGE